MVYRPSVAVGAALRFVIGCGLGLSALPTGGSAQFIVGYQGPGGVSKAAFVARAKELAATYGDRFTPPASLTK